MVDHGPRESGSSVMDAQGSSGISSGKSKMVEAIDLLVYSLQKYDKKYTYMKVLSKHPESQSAYTEATALRKYLGELCVIPEFKNVLTGNLNNVVNFLESNPDYGGVPKIKVDLNLIEVIYFFIFLP